MLTRTMVRREAGDTIYLRGEELQKNGSVKNIQVEKKNLQEKIYAHVQGSGNLMYPVRMVYSWVGDCIDEYVCTCAAYCNYDGMCKHCVAVALEYIEHWGDQDSEDVSDFEDSADFSFMRYGKRGQKRPPQTSPAIAMLLRQRVLKKTLPITDTANYGKVLLIPKLQRTEEGTKLTFLLGTADSHKYVLKDLVAFSRAIEQNEEFSYGRKLSFVHTREAFAEECRGLVDFICSWMGNNEWRYTQSYSYYGYYNSSAHSSKLREMILTDEGLEEFINIMDGRSFEGEINGQEYKYWHETDEKLSRILNITGEEEGLHVSVSHWEVCRGKKDNFYFLEGKVYRISRMEEDSIQDFLDCFQDMEIKRPLFVAFRDVPVFCREVLPALEKTFTPNYVSFHKEDYGVREVTFQIYLDAPERDCFTCRLQAVYGEQTYDLLKDNGIDAGRDTVREMQAGQQVRRYFNEYSQMRGELVLRDDEDMAYELLTRGIPEFQAIGEVFISEALKLVKVSPAPKPVVGVFLSGDLLELTLTAQDLSMEQLQEILSRYDRKKKFYRLRNGDFINMEEEAIGGLLELKKGLDLSDGQIKSGRIRLPKYRALYLDMEAKEWVSLSVERNREFKSLIRNMKTVEDNDFEVPPSLTNVLREYQKKGYLWLRTLKHNGFGGILADEMGLGKTLQVIAFLLSETTETLAANKTSVSEEAGVVAVDKAPATKAVDWNRNHRKPLALVVCPASLVYNWSSEIDHFAPELSVKMVVGTILERQALLENCKAGEILITSYDLLKRDIELYEPLEFTVQIIDEAQYIKNYNTQAARAVKEIRAGFKLALTGTPIENRLSELWSIFDYLMPGYLYSYSHFRDSYEVPIIQNQEEGARKRLQKMIRPFVLRRLKKDVLTDLPDKLEENLYARLEGEQRELYDAHVQRLRLSLDKQSEDEFKKEKIQILAELTKLRQLCCDPGLLYEGYGGESAKTQLCLDIVRDAISGGHKILLFSQFTTMLDKISQEFNREKISHYILTGATSKEERRRLVESFQSDETSVFCISLRAGGTGLNLTAADIVIHYDPWWNLAVQNQATDRTHRIGQENVVSVYKLIAKNTIEEKIMLLQEKKRELADQLLNAEDMGTGSFSREELLELLG